GYMWVGLGGVPARLMPIAGLFAQRAMHGRAEDALLEATARNSAILRAVPDLMFVNERNGTYVDYHARDRRLLFVPPEQFMGRTIPDAVPPAPAQRVLAAVAHGAPKPGPPLRE